ncbi:MAG: amidohydrolase [Bryobacterales bacterium]|nr:amidohydrolase [Bryobacterales bacterium]
MTRTYTRRAVLGQSLAVLPALAAARPKGTLVDTHIHIFSPDLKRFPYHANAVYRPPARPLEGYLEFVKQAGIDHTVIVHAEPYQDDHRLLEHCFRHEPSPGFFKGTCLFDPIAPDTPARMEAITRSNPGRIVALRIHETHERGTPSSTSGAIRDRDLRDPRIKNVWRKARELKLAIQFHFIPCYAPQIYDLAAEFQDVPVILDHLGRPGQGAPEEYPGVLRLAKLPRTYIKLCAVSSASKQKFPYRDVKPIVRRAFDAFGPDRFIWGGLGMDMKAFEQSVTMFEEFFDFTSEGNRAKIRGLNAMKLYGFRN